MNFSISVSLIGLLWVWKIVCGQTVVSRMSTFNYVSSKSTPFGSPEVTTRNKNASEGEIDVETATVKNREEPSDGHGKYTHTDDQSSAENKKIIKDMGPSSENVDIMNNETSTETEETKLKELPIEYSTQNSLFEIVENGRTFDYENTTDKEVITNEVAMNKELTAKLVMEDEASKNPDDEKSTENCITYENKEQGTTTENLPTSQEPQQNKSIHEQELNAGRFNDERNTYVSLENTANLTVEQQAERYLTSQIGKAINKYYLPVIVVLGFVGNSLTILVMQQSHNKKITCCVYLSSLALSDNLFLYVGAHYWTMTVLIPDYFRESMCKYLGYMFQTTSNLSAILITIVTIDRFMAVCFPLKFPACRTPSTARKVAIAAYITAFTWNSPIIYTARLIPKIKCAAIGGDNLFNKVYSWVSFCTNALIPFFTLCVLNLFIIRAIRNRNKYFDNLRSEEYDPNTSKEASENDQKIPVKSGKQMTKEGPDSSTERQLSVMLLIVTVAFLLLTAPQYTRYICFTFIDYKQDPIIYGIANLLFHVSNKLLWTNSAINFFLYCVAGSKFRKDLLILFRGTQIKSDKYRSQLSLSHSTDTHLSELDERHGPCHL